MRFPRGLWPAAVLIAAMLVGCKTSAPRTGVTEAMPAAAPDLAELFDSPALEAAEGILSGFDADRPDAGGAWRPGDAVLLGLVIERGPARQVRFLKVESPPEISFAPGSYTVTQRAPGLESIRLTSPLFVTALTLYDEQGRELSRSPGQFPFDCIGRGAYQGQIAVIRRLERGLPVPIPPEELRAMPREDLMEAARSSVWMIAMGPSMGTNPALQQLLHGIVEMPPLISLLFGTDLAISTVGTPARAGPVRLGGVEYPAASMALALSLNNRPAVEGSLTAVPAVAPLHLCGGLTALEARNPVHPERRVLVRLLACRRGGRD